MNKLKFHILFGLVLSFSFVLNGQNHTVFKHLSPMLDNKPVAIASTTQDHLGNIWMVGGGGVLIYDGYGYKFIKSTTIFSTLKKNDGIEKIITDSNKNIWLISMFGLVTKYNAKNSTFENITPLLKKDDGIIDIIIKKENVWLASKKGNIYQYKNSKIHSTYSISNINTPFNNIYDFEIGTDEFYLSTNNGKIFSYDINSKQVVEIIGPFTDYPESLTLLIDSNNKLWVGTETFGLFVYDIKSKQFIQETFFKEKKFNINKEMFLNLFYSSNGYIYGGTDGGGLYKINVNTGTIDLYTRQASNESSINSNTIRNISEDNHKNLWISTKNGNLNIIPNSNNNIGYHQGSENNAPLRILSIYKSTNGALWAGTDGSGLTKITYNNDGTTNETQYFNNTNLNKGFYVQSIIEDNKANIWFGTYRNGLWHYNTKKNTFKKINVINSKKQEATDVRTVFKDSKGRIWVGSNVSLSIYNSDLALLASFNNSSNGLKGFILESMTEDDNGTLWLGIYQGGLFEFNENQENLSLSTFTSYLYSNKKNENEIYASRNLCSVSLNELWLTNNDWEILKFNTKTKTYSNLNYIEAVNGKTFATIIKEDDDNYWLSSSNGINHLNIKDETLKTYYTSDGLQDNMFLSRSAFKDKKGIIYFGGIKGLNYFDPKKLEKSSSNAKLFINTIKVLNQPANSLIASQVTSGIHNIKTLNLDYNQSSFSFRFSAIDNLLSPKYYYAYRLKGFDKEWITSPERIASYTNIPSGNYTFEVKAGTKKNVWDIPVKHVEIKIEQPLWNKPIAYIVYLLVIGAIIYGIRRWYGLRKKLFLEKVSHKKENEIHKAKMNFFAKMSHEIQTPITLILGPIDDMLKRSEQNGNLLLKQRLNIISQNTKRLSKIARELTLVRNKELDKLRLIITKNNLHQDVENIALSFKELARKKQIDFAVNCPKNLSEAWYDKEKLEHIVYNLLSNAFKFTPKEGNVQLNVIPIDSKRTIKLSVIDSGPGIPKNELETIFELFYQSNIGKKNKGSGIGLALTKDLVDLHKGEIKVNSKASEGTTFTITLPIKEDDYNENERITTSDSNEFETKTITTTNDIETIEQNDLDLSKKTILIVEDNYDLQNFLKDLLIDKYNILLAENGEEGYLYAKNNYPDLILSDIMMPKVDGIEMCRKLQINQLTKHIPIILLTAKNSTSSKIHGLKSGAIEYINKPFNTNELLLKVKNIMVSKEHIISKYRKEVISHPEVTQQKTHDEIFLENMMSYINLRLDDPNFKMEELADALNLSYSSLYRKCMALTGQSIVDFVRLLRLKKAAILITKYGYTISETAYMVGFNDPKYFSKSFKNQFNKTPKDFKNRALSSEDVESFLKQNKIDSATFSN